MGSEGFGGLFFRLLVVGTALSVAGGVLVPAAGVGTETEPLGGWCGFSTGPTRPRDCPASTTWMLPGGGVPMWSALLS